MDKLKYLQKIIQKEAPEQKGPIFNCKTLKKLFKSFFADSKFKFHSGYVENNSISLVGYRTLLNESKLGGAYFDPFLTINDYGIIETSNNIVYFESSNNDIKEIIVSSLKQNFGEKVAQKYLQDYERFKNESLKETEDKTSNL